MRVATFAFGLAVASAVAAPSSEAADVGRFDGLWEVLLACPNSPDGAAAFTFEFVALVNNGLLHGEKGMAGRPGWLVLDGPIQPDGTAVLDARGVTGQAPYNVHQTGRGVPYDHLVMAHFDTDRGAGTWATTRVCNFTFTRS